MMVAISVGVEEYIYNYVLVPSNESHKKIQGLNKGLYVIYY